MYFHPCISNNYQSLSLNIGLPHIATAYSKGRPEHRRVTYRKYRSSLATLSDSVELMISVCRCGVVFVCVGVGVCRQVALERGEKLSELEEKTERMKLEAEAYSSTSHQLKMKYRDKKWYQFWQTDREKGGRGWLTGQTDRRSNTWTIQHSQSVYTSANVDYRWMTLSCSYCHRSSIWRYCWKRPR